ncbi:MAG: hypothetical protein ABJF04_03300 [Reichenbachiella sp.]|uniref:hypothetical protein n=1 Tax=Reichenbachiella sp. TaxID=2184521 RepID=UPI003267D895
MEQKDLIIQLIQQDLKHNKLTKSLMQIGLDDGGLYGLEILTIVCELMGIKDDNLSDTWADVYYSFLNEVYAIDPSELDDKLPFIANQCYGLLKSLVEIENRINPKL